MTRHRRIGRGEVRHIKEAHALDRKADGITTKARRRHRPRTKRTKLNIEVTT